MDHSKWLRTLGQICAGLQALNSSTEQDFLSLGSCLGDVSQQSGEIAGMACEVAGIISGEEFVKAIRDLKTILDQLSSHSAESERALDANGVMMRDVLLLLQQASVPLTGFKRIVKHLKVLGISTKIESARLSSGDQSFDTLAQDVEELSKSIAEKSDHIMIRIEGLRAEIGHTLAEVQNIKAVGRGQTEGVLANIRSSLSFVSEKYMASSATAHGVASRSGEITKEIEEIVSSLQFHDITRQQIEHVSETLSEVAERLRGEIEKGHGANGDEPVDIGALADAASDVCELQAEQLRHAKEELVHAVHNIIARLARVADQANYTVAETAQLVSVAGETGSSFLDELGAGLASVVRSLDESGCTSSRLSKAIGSVATTIGDLASFVGAIEEIGSEIELIALNARIKASHTGSEGAALGILAEAIRHLSVGAREQTQLVTSILKDISACAGSLGDGQSNRQGDGVSSEVYGIADGIGALLHRFQGVNANLSSIISRLDGVGQNLAEVVDETVRDVQVHFRVEAALSDLIDNLRETVAEIRTCVGHGDRKIKESHLKSLSSRYTMNQERVVHDLHLQKAGAKPQKPGPYAVAPVAQGRGDHFDSNVELF